MSFVVVRFQQPMKQIVQRATALRDTISHDDLDRLVQQARHSHDAQEGVAAQLERRPPVFRGE